jgi:hypothetical protein
MTAEYWETILNLIENHEISFEDASAQYWADSGDIEHIEGFNKEGK